MKWKKLGEDASAGYVIIFSTGDEVASGLLDFARNRKITAAHFTAIGALSRAKLGYFDWNSKKYLSNAIEEQVEVLSLIGDIALDGDQPKVHAHMVLGKRDGTAWGGHLLEAQVRPTLEVMLEESPAHLVKKIDPESGLALIAL